MATGKITKTSVEAIKPGASNAFLWSTEIKGFGVKVTPAGKRVYVFQYRPKGSAKTRRINIGTHGKMTAAQAETQAKTLALALETKGEDPHEARLAKEAAKAAERKAAEEAEERAKRLRIDALADAWKEALPLPSKERKKKLRPSTIDFYTRIVDTHIKPNLGEFSLPDLTSQQVDQMLDDLPAGSTALRRNIFATLSSLSRWATKRYALPVNPMKDMERPEPAEPRAGSLKDHVIPIFWQATGTLRPAHRALYRLLLLTAARREEVAGMKWQEVDMANALWTLPPDRAKNGTETLIPLSPLAMAELTSLAGDEAPTSGPVLSLDGTRSIAGFSKARIELDKAMADVAATIDPPPVIEPWVVHDLRRTVATGLQRIGGVRFEVIEAVLNHKIGGLRKVYQLYQWREEKTEALNRWADHVQSLITPEERESAEIITLAG